MRLIDADALPRYTGYALSAVEIARAVENAPTIDAVPVRHGEWQWISAYSFYRCSECYEIAERRTPYCPNCGAKMNGGKDDEHSD